LTETRGQNIGRKTRGVIFLSLACFKNRVVSLLLVLLLKDSRKNQDEKEDEQWNEKGDGYVTRQRPDDRIPSAT
jgi:hypothetical protein